MRAGRFDHLFAGAVPWPFWLDFHGAPEPCAPVDGEPGQWRIDLKGASGPSRLKIKCGQGSSAQWVRDQIFEQFLA